MSTEYEIVELGHPFGPGALRFGSHPFTYELTLLHQAEWGEGQLPGSSGASDRISLGLHVGTHIDSLSHVGMEGKLCDGTDVFGEQVQDPETGIEMRSGSGLRPIVAPGILLDFPGYLGCEVLEDGHEITVEELTGCAAAAGVEIEPGSVVLIRTGFDLLWDRDPERFVNPPFPGPGLEAARFLREREVVATGSDTAPYELYPSAAGLSVHVELLVRGGIFIIESLRLDQLASRGAVNFQFIALPLKLPKATGSPLSPVALLPGA